jgi:hypothetical protein
MINKTNFYIATFEACNPPGREPDYVSGSSKYWFEGDYLYRDSDHWHTVAFCMWDIIAPNDVDFYSSANPKFKALNSYRNGKIISLCGRVLFSEMGWRRADVVENAKKFFKCQK